MTNQPYWKDVVAKLYTDANWASHVLSTGLSSKDGYKDTNLEAALKECTAEEVIRGVFFAYEDDSAKPYCDLILSKFDNSIVNECFNSINNPSDNMVKWVRLFLLDRAK